MIALLCCIGYAAALFFGWCMCKAAARGDALIRHGQRGDAVTDIYNRAYEAVLEVQDALNVSAAVTARQIAENAKNLQRAEAAENVINAAHAVLARQVAEPHTSRGDTNAMVEAITILETVTLKGGEE